MESPNELKAKKIKLKKHIANKISSLKTITSKKQRMEKTNNEARKNKSNIEKEKRTIEYN